MLLENYSALIIQDRHFSLFTNEGEILTLSQEACIEQLRHNRHLLVIHRPFTFRKLRSDPDICMDQWLDLAELAAFIYPTLSCGYGVNSFIEALNLPAHELPDLIEADFLLTLTDHLLERLQEEYDRHEKNREIIAGQLSLLYQNQWNWAPVLLTHLKITLPLPAGHMHPLDSIRIWKRLPKWEDIPPRPQSSQYPVKRIETLERLSLLLGPDAENRIGQTDFTDIARFIFEPCQDINSPNTVLAEAGTGTGKTLAYIAPASLWAEKNQGTVWINTYTKHLQKQIEQEFIRLYPDPEIRNQHIVVRKGRENYLCLLNLEEYVSTFSYSENAHKRKTALILLIRWAEKTNDGDLFGGDLPNWFHDLFNEQILYHVAERKGECLHGACPHFQNCFVEHSIQKAHHADIVIANHALLMNHFAWHLDKWHQDKQTETQQSPLPTRLIFDEAHHLLNAADSAYTVALSALETSELRRWLLGNEGNNTRAKGLKKRIHDIIIGHSDLETLLEDILQLAHILPTPNWSSHLSNQQEDKQFSALNPMEKLFFLIHKQVIVRCTPNPARVTATAYHDQNECDLFPILPELKELIPDVIHILNQLLSSLKQFIHELTEKLEDSDNYTHDRIETTISSLQRRALNPLILWLDLLNHMQGQTNFLTETDTHFTYLKINKKGTHLLDIGIFHHWLDPTLPLMNMLQQNTHGMLFTSATLRDDSNNDTEQTWHAAEQLTGTNHLEKPPVRAALSCSFDYEKQARIYIVNDLNHQSITSLAYAYSQLFLASHGGGLGLFTAIQRLKNVYQKIEPLLEENHIPLYAQHIDPLSNHGLVELFKGDHNSCLLGTDAMRDGINIPGDSLRLVVFEKMPWPRPDLLYRERRKYFGKESPQIYDDQMVRLKLRQAFGRLIRNQTDRGIFIILDRRTPTRILSAFPKETPIVRLPLEQTIQEVKNFFSDLHI